MSENYFIKEAKNRKKRWDKSKDKLWLVIMNMGGSLWGSVVEVRRDDDEDKWYSSRDCNTVFDAKKHKQTRGCSYFSFKAMKDAELFLAGAKAFQKFSVNLINPVEEEEEDDDNQNN